ncbi:MAG: hypothetical protein HY922_08850 [Elusimicrobia bacterium]|nr:hypothetical protein [Elusimicrobiota bacterium]
MNRNLSWKWFVGAAGFISLLLAGLGVARLYATGGAYSSTEHGGNNVNANAYTGVNRIATEPTIACAQCHYKHASYSGSSTGGPYNETLFAANNNAICYNSTCHGVANFHGSALNRIWPGQTTYDLSGHGSSTALYYYPITGGRQTKLCLQCHDPHGASDSTNGVYPRNTNYLEQNGCYSNNSTANAGCHGNNAGNRPTNAKDVYTQVTKTYKHDPALATKIHSSVESQSVNSGAFSGANRHAECVDCHNPHLSKLGTHTPGSTNPPGNVISNALLGAWGVKPNPWPATPGTAATLYTAFELTDTSASSTEYEGHLCLKCHSYFAYGASPPAGQTDATAYFNPNNPAYHPVFAAGKNASMPSSLLSPWTSTSKMYCSDCHSTNETVSASVPDGAHGSINAKILNKPYAHTDAAQPSTDLCFTCHDYAAYVGGTSTASNFKSNSTTNVHFTNIKEQYGCDSCHAVHGTTVKPHLIAIYDATLFPYSRITAFTDRTPPGSYYAKGDCTTRAPVGGEPNCH